MKDFSDKERIHQIGNKRKWRDDPLCYIIRILTEIKKNIIYRLKIWKKLLINSHIKQEFCNIWRITVIQFINLDK